MSIKVKNSTEKELDKAQEQFDAFDSQVKTMTVDHMNKAPKQEVDPQTKLSSREIQNSKDIYLKPVKAIGSREKFNEDYREQYNFSKEYVQFIAENREIIGESIEVWTKPYAGMPAEYWVVPVNKPIWGPRYLAENLKKCSYHRLRMEDKVTENVGVGQIFGQMIVDTNVQRLDAHPASTRKSVFMGASGF